MMNKIHSRDRTCVAVCAQVASTLVRSWEEESELRGCSFRWVIFWINSNEHLEISIFFFVSRSVFFHRHDRKVEIHLKKREIHCKSFIIHSLKWHGRPLNFPLGALASCVTNDVSVARLFWFHAARSRNFPLAISPAECLMMLSEFKVKSHSCHMLCHEKLMSV